MIWIIANDTPALMMDVMTTDDLARVLSASQLLRGVDPTIVGRMAKEAQRYTVPRGERVWQAGNVAAWSTVVVTGLVKIVRAGPDGSESTVAIFGPRESIGDMAVVSGRPYPADAIVITPSADLVRVPVAIARTLMAEHPALAAAYTASVVEHTQALHEKIRIMSAGTTDKRLATLLLYLARRFGDETEDGSIFVPIVLSRGECARLIGTAVETTIRTFTKWEREGIVETTPDGFALHDAARLEDVTVG